MIWHVNFTKVQLTHHIIFLLRRVCLSRFSWGMNQAYFWPLSRFESVPVCSRCLILTPLAPRQPRCLARYLNFVLELYPWSQTGWPSEQTGISVAFGENELVDKGWWLQSTDGLSPTNYCWCPKSRSSWSTDVCLLQMDLPEIDLVKIGKYREERLRFQ